MKKEKWQEQTVVCFFLFEMFACFSINRKKNYTRKNTRNMKSRKKRIGFSFCFFNNNNK